MAENALVEALWEDAVELVKKLDDEGSYSPKLAVWYYYEDAEQWRLLIGGQGFDDLLPKKEALAYKKISECISSLDLATLSISMVKLIRTQDPLPQTLRVLIGTGEKGITQATVSNTTINGIFIKDIVVIRSS